MRVYEILEDLTGQEPMNYPHSDFAREYEVAFDTYLGRDFQGAHDLFTSCLQKQPLDFLSSHYLASCSELLLHPPSPEWHGVIKLEEK